MRLSKAKLSVVGTDPVESCGILDETPAGFDVILVSIFCRDNNADSRMPLTKDSKSSCQCLCKRVKRIQMQK